MKSFRKLWCLTALLATCSFYLGGFHNEKVSANNAPQTLPFTQNWSSTGLITTDDDWSGVPGVEGFLGQDMTTATGTDPRTLLATSGVINDLDVNANESAPDTFATGGVAEFEITNPTIALNGSGTADAPHILIHLNTTGQSNIRISYNLRDLDASVDNSVQPFALQYRVGNSGSFINVPGGFVADATTGPSQATLVTAVAATLPAAANNSALVQVRIMTTNAAGNDEWVGVDDISISTVATPARMAAPVDFNGDAISDFAVVRNTGGGAGGQLTWYVNYNRVGPAFEVNWGISTDWFLPEDYDGDGKADIAVFRHAAAAGASAFYILNSSDNSVRIESFGQEGDDPSVVADYDGDGKADLAVYREGKASGDQSTWFYRGSLNNPSGGVTYVPWGQNGDFPTPGDYDGDGRCDFVVQRSSSGQGAFWMLQTTAGFQHVVFGHSTDQVAPGDWDGDGKDDIAVVRSSGGQYHWYYRRSIDGALVGLPLWGLSASDFVIPGDYDGDGRIDQAVWRNGGIWIRNSTTGGLQMAKWGQTGDYPVANSFVY